jgi:hypothetical protein
VGSAVKLDAKSETEAGYARILVDLPVLHPEPEPELALRQVVHWQLGQESLVALLVVVVQLSQLVEGSARGQVGVAAAAVAAELELELQPLPQDCQEYH